MSQAPENLKSTTAASGDFEESPFFYGRWTAEEERYAEMLISEFRDGNLDDIDLEEGPNTLRGFLAAKLRCAPKRISKKFESSGYNGRMQYVLKKGAMTPAESAKRHQELETLRQAFEVRRSGLPKKPIKKKRSAMSSASRRSTSGANSLARDAAIVARDTAANSPQAPPSINNAEASLPSLSLGYSSSAITGGVMDSLRGMNASAAGINLGPSAASLLASTQFQRNSATDAILARSRTLIPAGFSDVSALQASMLPPRQTAETALLNSLLGGAAGNNTGFGFDNQLLAAHALKRRMDNARLYAILHREASENAQSNLLLHEQIQQRKRVQEALDNAGRSVEGPPSKRPRAA